MAYCVRSPFPVLVLITNCKGGRYDESFLGSAACCSCCGYGRDPLCSGEAPAYCLRHGMGALLARSRLAVSEKAGRRPRGDVRRRLSQAEGDAEDRRGTAQAAAAADKTRRSHRLDAPRRLYAGQDSSLQPFARGERTAGGADPDVLRRLCGGGRGGVQYTYGIRAHHL